MNKNVPSSFRRPEDAPVDLSPAAVARYRILAEQERNKAVASFFRRLFNRDSVTSGHHSPLPAE